MMRTAAGGEANIMQDGCAFKPAPLTGAQLMNSS